VSAWFSDGALARTIRTFEHLIVLALIAMLMVVIALATIELAWILIEDVLTPPIVLLDIGELLEIFGFVLLILIGIELLETIKAYRHTHAIRLDIVLEVALIAIARKIIIIDVGTDGGVSVLGIAALVLALAVADYVARRSRMTARASGGSTAPSGDGATT
jgi:uncharacterized membrane protein (DUF373 family)